MGGLPDFSRVPEALAAHAADVAQRVAEAVRAVAPVGKTGRLAAGIDAQAEPTASGFRVTVTSDVPYDVFVREGTAPHEIRAAHTTTTRRGTVRAGSLAFTAGGGQVFCTAVQHPGTAANDYPEQAADSIAGILGEAVGEAVRAALGGG